MMTSIEKTATRLLAALDMAMKKPTEACRCDLHAAGHTGAEHGWIGGPVAKLIDRAYFIEYVLSNLTYEQLTTFKKQYEEEM